MDNVSVMSILEQANRGESAIDFSDLPPYDDFLDASLLGLQPALSNQRSVPSEIQSQEVNDQQLESKDIECEANDVENEAKETGTETKLIETGNVDEPCGFDDAVDIHVIARNTDRIVLALSDGVSQRQLVFCPSTSMGYGLWLIGGLSSLVPATYVDAMKGRLLALDEVIKAQYNVIIEHFASQRKGIERRVKSKIESRIEGWLEQKGRLLLKQSLLGKEGEMPAVVQKTVSEVVDFVWPDVKIELWALYDSVMGHDEDSQWDIVPDSPLSEPSPKDSTPAATKASAPSWRNPILFAKNSFHSFRCFVLYTLSPFNRSFGKKIKNSWWWFIKLIRILPFYSMSSLSFLLTLLLIDRTDEFQLISFILEFKGTQFIGVGMISTLTGALRYVKCVNFQPSLRNGTGENQTSFSHTCDVSGPGSNNNFYLDFLGFVLQIVLVWVAFFHLPYTKTRYFIHLSTGGNKGLLRYKADDASFAKAMRDEFEVDNEWQVVDTKERWALVGTDSSEEPEEESDQEIAEEAELDSEPVSAQRSNHVENQQAEDGSDGHEEKTSVDSDSPKLAGTPDEPVEQLETKGQPEAPLDLPQCIPPIEDTAPVEAADLPCAKQTEESPLDSDTLQHANTDEPQCLPTTPVTPPSKSSEGKCSKSGSNLRRRKIPQEQSLSTSTERDEDASPSSASSEVPPSSPEQIISAASGAISAAYTSCVSFASSATNFTRGPSDSSRQQLRSFRTYLERLGAQRERGRLLYMLKYDLCVFCVLSTLFVASTARRAYMFWDVPLSDWEWQIRADMYWLRTLYGLLSAPFVVFVLPIFAQVLLHLRPTGYTPDGRCVPQQRRGAPPPR